MASGGIKGYYRQKKSGVSKSPAKPKSKPKSSTKKSSKAAASLGSDGAQLSALISHGSLDLQGDYDESEDLLRQFDMNMAYGPCIGMSRLDRWERANSLGLDPPKELGDLLRGGKVGVECLWDGRV
ncbi:DNA polymerase delta subunit 4 [Telopea speciosissima]|uniref:DNA polymerase delta subunit 4 n=1 Tax=Telopea speciosissima TaxID=54955 RepID=UPI001CC36BD5|nr:DNA polymerase delta subunit 4 [Telopea speciosissima]